ncbi:DUF3413 domain-containing protein [Marinimicrobium sp. ARAG 43.8]|uniref:DUF3413 domain-containing protein n=1 Tax=Marinimicrobium sp. ARAG 43.8 TaxID=3418719 RepID=UPI003CF22389
MPQVLTARQRLRWMGWFITVNSFIALLIGIRYLHWIDVPDISTGVYVATAYVAQFSLLAWLLGVPLLLLALILPRRVLLPIAVLGATLAISLLLLDTVVYHQYRFHLSGFVLELLLGAGSEIFSFSWLTWTVGLLAILAIVLLQRDLARRLRRHLPQRGLWVPLTVLFASQLIAHGWNAWADANYDTRITSVARHLPLYHAATAKRFMAEHGLVDPQKVRDNQLAQKLGNISGNGALNYPQAPLQCHTPEHPYNLLVIAVDALRADMLDPRWMPNTYTFAQQQALVFNQHYSNGNATKPGIFTLFYGLPASYWDAFSAHRQPPVLIERLQALGYDTGVFSSATLVSPAFDRNVFSSIPDLRLKTPGEHSWQRDQNITAEWLRFLDQHQAQTGNGDKPFFGFLFYDAPHSYDVPPDYPRIEPFWETVNQLALDEDFDPEPYFNVYKTTVRFTDEQVQQVLADLEQRQLLDSTVVVITSDHGQEFNDNGQNYWGHGSNFSKYQLQVPMVVHWPGKAPAHIDTPTEHFDVAPTLMAGLLGCEGTTPSTYATGEGLLAKPQRTWSIAHSYMNSALLTDHLQMVTYPGGGVDVLTPELQPAKGQSLPVDVISQALKEQSRFYP